MLYLNEIAKDQFDLIFQTIPANSKKWIVSFYHQKQPICFEVLFLESNEIIGFGYYLKKGSYLDFSFLIFPQHQKKGYGTNILNLITSKYFNCVFTVFKFNNVAMKFFDSYIKVNYLKMEEEYDFYIYRLN